MVIVGSGDGPVRTASGAADQRGVRLPLPWAEHVASIAVSVFGGRVGGALALGWAGLGEAGLAWRSLGGQVVFWI